MSASNIQSDSLDKLLFPSLQYRAPKFNEIYKDTSANGLHTDIEPCHGSNSIPKRKQTVISSPNDLGDLGNCNASQSSSDILPNNDADVEPLDDHVDRCFVQSSQDEKGLCCSPSSLTSILDSTLYQDVSDDIWSDRGQGALSQVDYLSHEWTEPNIWTSWRYVRLHKNQDERTSVRLENASWRAWMKVKCNLKVTPPERLHW